MEVSGWYRVDPVDVPHVTSIGGSADVGVIPVFVTA